MKVLAIAVFLTIIGVSVSELCDGVDTSTCVHEVCGDDQTPRCEDEVCTCGDAPEPGECDYLSDCDSYWFWHHCPTAFKHCIDSECKCRVLSGDTGADFGGDFGGDSGIDFDGNLGGLQPGK